MAHEIDSIAYAGATPWHQLGTRMTQDQRTNLEAAMDAAGLTWAVELVNVQYARHGMTHDVTDARGVVRTDTGAYLGTVGTDYRVIQNRDAFSVVEPLIAAGCQVEVMASLRGGARTLALVRLPDATTAPIQGDDVRGYVLLQTAHDGSGATKATLTPIRVVCANTLALAERSAHSTVVSIRHTSSAEARIVIARDLIHRMHDAFTAAGVTFAEMAKREMKPAEIAQYIETLIPARVDPQTGQLADIVRRRRDTIADLIFHGRGNSGDASTGRASLWHTYNAVTEYFDHTRRQEAASKAGADAAAESALIGANARIKAQAFAMARQLVTA